MTNFAALIDRAIARDTRTKLTAFLTIFEHLEFGRSRRLEPEEVALVLSAVDRFLVNDSFASLEVPELDRLSRRLASIAAQEDLASSDDETRVRNACFDALACIKALEAALSRRLHQRAIMSSRLAAPRQPANDP